MEHSSKQKFGNAPKKEKQHIDSSSLKDLVDEHVEDDFD
jgi:hypothetical protein